MAAFVEWVTREILESVEHRQYVWTIPKVLRGAFRRDRSLLEELSRCAWKALRDCAHAVLGQEWTPGEVDPQQAQRVRASTDSLFWDDLPVFER